MHFEEKIISRLDNRHLTSFCEFFFYMNLTENHAIFDFIMVGLWGKLKKYINMEIIIKRRPLWRMCLMESIQFCEFPLTKNNLVRFVSYMKLILQFYYLIF